MTKQCIDLDLDMDQIATIRKALVIGLASYGEIERLCNLHELAKFGSAPFPDSTVPIHPTGSADVASTFATALAFLEV